MKLFLSCILGLVWSMVLSGCGAFCQAGTGTCGMSNEQAAKLLYPKSYGEYWVKPGVSKEVWRQDWVACGGWANGQYGADAPPGANGMEILAASKRTSQKLDSCMQSKGYIFQRS